MDLAKLALFGMCFPPLSRLGESWKLTFSLLADVVLYCDGELSSRSSSSALPAATVKNDRDAETVLLNSRT